MNNKQLYDRISLLEQIIELLVEDLSGIWDYNFYNIIRYYINQEEYEKVYNTIINGGK